MPSISDYYEPWTYDYENLITAPPQRDSPVARPKSLISGKDMKVSWSANWDDDLAGGPALTAADPVLARKSPQWRRVSSSSTWRWHDHRTHWMERTPPPIVRAEPHRAREFGK